MDWQTSQTSFTNYLKLKKYSKTSQKHYLASLNHFKLFLEKSGITDVRKVSNQNMKQYQETITKTSLSIWTQKLYIRAVKKYYGHLAEENHILITPCEDMVTIPDLKTPPKVILTPEEKEKIINRPDTKIMIGIRDRAILELLFSTGMRSGECVGVTVYDVDTKSGLVRVRGSMTGRERVLPMGKETIKWVKQYQETVRPASNRKKPHIRTLFLLLNGNPLTTLRLQDRISKYIKLSGVRKKGINCQSFRNTFAMEQIKNDTDIITLQKLLGHKNVSSTRDYVKTKKMKE